METSRKQEVSMKKELEKLFEDEEEEGGFPNLDKYLEGRKHNYVNYTEGARMYRIPYYSFVRLATWIPETHNYGIRYFLISGVASNGVTPRSR